MSNVVADLYQRRRDRVGFGDAVMPEWGAGRARADGVAFQHQAYPSGVPGVRRSLTEMARLMREARLDKDVIGYSADVLRAAGLDGRDRTRWTVKNIAQCFLDNVREVTIYAPDAHGAEVIVSPAGLLCLRPGLCIRRGDCDDQAVLLGSLLLCSGLSVRVVKQSWGPDAQEHVLVAVQDESGAWLKCDPSHASLPVGRGVNARSEEFYDPMSADCSIDVGSSAEIVTFGALPGFGKPPKPPTTQPVQHRRSSVILPHAQLPGVGRGGGGHGGHGGGGGGHGGGGGRSFGGPHRFSGGRWWGWDGTTWVVNANFGCLQWGALIANPDPGLVALARSHAGSLPASDVYNGVSYLFAANGIRPCIAVAGVGRAVNDQLSPRGVGVGFVSDDDVLVVIQQTAALMDATNAGVQGCSNLASTDVTVWNGVYTSWQTWLAALNNCVDDLVPSAHTQCLPYYRISDGWTPAKQGMLGYQTTAMTMQGNIKAACPSFQPTPPLPTPPPLPPGPPGGGTGGWIDNVKTTGAVVGGVLVLGVASYVAYKVVQVASEYASKKPAATKAA